MSHIHLPDGVLPANLWLLSYLAAWLWLRSALRQSEKEAVQRKLPFVAAMSALMLLTMSIPLGPLPFHLNLTVLTGIVVGPWLGFVAVVIVNIILSLLGHGGLTTIGINSLIAGLEVVVGWWLYHRLLHSWRRSWRTLLATGLALLLSISLSLGIVGSSTGMLDLAGHELHLGQDPIAEEQPAATLNVSTTAAMGGEQGEIAVKAELLGLTGIGALAGILLAGLGLESLATLGIISYLQKVNPDLLQDEGPDIESGGQR